MKGLRAFGEMLKQAFSEFNTDNAPRLAAALAYYAALSLAPLLVIVISVVGFVLQGSEVRQEVLDQVTSYAGSGAATFVDEAITNLSQPRTGIISSILSLGALLFGAIGAFDQLKGALNTVWNVPESEIRGGVGGFIRDKLIGFGMILFIGFLLLVSIVLSTVLSAIQSRLADQLPGGQTLLGLANFGVTIGIVLVVFAVVFRYLPDIHLQWRDVWIGAALTAVLFTIGNFLMGRYLVNSGVTSAYGAAGSFVLILFWIYYSAQIVLFGAEFTQVYSRRYGSLQDEPTPDKEAAKQEEKGAKQPLPSGARP